MKKTLFICLSAFLLLACQNKETKTELEEVIKEEPLVEVDHTTTSDSPLYLDDGKPWKINEEMKPHVSKGEETFETYIKNDEDKDYKSLAQNLTEENNKLIESCTMTGESHDVLHEWLAPHLELTAALKDADNQKEAEEVIRQLDHSFKEFHKYFK